MRKIAEEILQIDEDAPVTVRNYSRRNPPVSRSATGIPVLLRIVI